MTDHPPQASRGPASQGAGRPVEAHDASLPLQVLTSPDGTGPTPAGEPNPGRLRHLFSRLRYLPFVMLAAATIGVVALYFQPPGLQALMRALQLEPGAGTSTPIAVPAHPRPVAGEAVAAAAPVTPVVMGLGKLLPDGDVRTIAPPFGAGDAAIEQLHVNEGDRVQAGSLLATLDNARNLGAIVRAAESAVASREAAYEQIKQSVMASQAEARASLQSARSALAVAQADLERNQVLVERGFISGAVLDQKRAARDQARDAVERLRATLARFEAKSIDAQPDVVVAARNVDAARSDLARAISDLARSRVVSPIDGTVLQVHVRPGERPGNQGILDLGNTDRMTAEAEVFQTAIGAVTLGAPVTLTAEALPRALHGTVSRIGLEVGSQTLVDASPAARTDARVVRVQIALDRVSSEAARRFTNLQVLARIEVTGK